MVQQKLKWPYADIRLGNDRGVLRLQFSTKVSQKYFGKRQAYKGLGRPDTSYNYQWATGICQRIQSDLDHPDNLFDPTFEKYLGGTVVNFPNQKQVPKLGASFEAYAERLYKLGKIGESTYKANYLKEFLSMLKPWHDDPINRELAETIVAKFNESNKNKTNKIACFSVLIKVGDWLIEKEELTKNPFKGLEDSITTPRKSTVNEDGDNLGENDYRSFTQQERDTIIEAFYNDDKQGTKHIAPLIEFLFRTGCRTCEAFPLTWSDIKWDKRVIVFSKSYESNSKALSKGKTKNGTIRVFPFYEKLEALLLRLKEERYKGVDEALIFPGLSSNKANVRIISQNWAGRHSLVKGKSYYYPGVVTQLANQGKIGQYLKPYSTRHTFITLQVLGTLNDPNDKTNFIGKIKLIADIVGNSVETIQKHYLDKPKEAQVLNI